MGEKPELNFSWYFIREKSHSLALETSSPKERAELYDLVIINDLDNKYPQDWIECGLAYYELKEYKVAIQRFDGAIVANPTSHSAFSNRGNCKSALQLYEDAKMDYNKAIELKPTYASAYCNRGTLYSILNISDQAISDYSKAIALKGDYADAYFNRSIEQAKCSEFDLSFNDVNKAIECSNNNIQYFTHRGMVNFARKNYIEAVKDYNYVLKINPNYEFAKKNLEIALKQIDIELKM